MFRKDGDKLGDKGFFQGCLNRSKNILKKIKETTEEDKKQPAKTTQTTPIAPTAPNMQNNIVAPAPEKEAEPMQAPPSPRIRL